MNFYYVELEGVVIKSYGDATDMDLALENTKGKVLEITQTEYKLLSACRGDIQKGIFTLHGIVRKIAKAAEES